MSQKSAPSPNDLLGKNQHPQGGPAPVKGELVTYLPRDGDPPKIKWGGKTFHANIGLPIDNPILLAKARANKWFHVGEGAPVVVVEETIDPKTPEQYRAHVAGWLKTVHTLDELEQRWSAEEPLRQACGVGGEDFDLLGSMISPRRAELKRAGLPG